MSKLFYCGILALLVAGSPLSGREVAVILTAEVLSVSGVFAEDPALKPGMVASGVVRYDTETSDGNVLETTGWYFQDRLVAFELSVAGTEVLGSKKTQVQVENFSSTDTFRVVDGDLFEFDREMTLNGEKRNTLRLILAITDTSGQAFDSDDLPEAFPLVGGGEGGYPFSTTFSLIDTGGALTLRMRRVVQAEVPVDVPLVMNAVEVDGEKGEVRLVWSAVAGRRYGVEWSADLSAWERFPGDVWAATGEAEWRGGGGPGYYRVVESEP